MTDLARDDLNRGPEKNLCSGPQLRERYDRVMAKPSSEDFSGEDLHELAAVGKAALDEIERLQAELDRASTYRATAALYSSR